MIIGLPALMSGVWFAAEVQLHRTDAAQVEAHTARFACWAHARASCPAGAASSEDAVSCRQVFQACQAQGFETLVSDADAGHARWQRRTLWARVALIAVSLGSLSAWAWRALRSGE